MILSFFIGDRSYNCWWGGLSLCGKNIEVRTVFYGMRCIYLRYRGSRENQEMGIFFGRIARPISSLSFLTTCEIKAARSLFLPEFILREEEVEKVFLFR